MSARPTDALVAAAATIAAVLGLTTLTEDSGWVGRAVWACLAVAATGVLVRRLTSLRILVALAQIVVVVWVVVAMFARERLWYGIPGPAAWGRVAQLVKDFADVVHQYAAPIPDIDGVQLVFVAAVAALAVVVDYLAVTEQAPGVAGLPLVAAFFTAAANSVSSLSLWYFVVAAVGWLVLVARQGSWRVRRWSTTVASPQAPTADEDVETEALGRYGNVARQLGLAAVVAAVVLPAVVPHMPTRYILDGLGRSEDSAGRGGRVGFSSTLDLSRSLQSGDRNIVMTYRTSAPSAPPLRVVVASTYVGGDWRQRPLAGPTQTLVEARTVAPQVKVVDRQLDVESNYLSAPHVASVPPVVSTDFGGASWSADPGTGDLYAPNRPDSYSFTYREVDVTAQQLRAGIPGASSGRDDPEVQAARQIEPGLGAQLRALTQAVTGGAQTSYDAAVAIQDWLRSKGGFTYSLQLVDRATDANGMPITDPVLRFLATKQGYCVQFASAMVMMARAEGIPARMAVGFLPGTLQNGVYTVRSSDAHSWPELYFPGAGWLRFEPTPAVRSGAAPAYALPDTTPVPTVTTAPQPDSAATGTATATQRDPGAPEAAGSAAGVQSSVGERLGAWLGDPLHLVLVAALLGILGTLVLPVTARLVNRRRRARAASPGELAEAQWDELVSRLGDLGVPRPLGGVTLRQWRAHYAREAYLDDSADAAMGKVVATLERSRYARPGSDPVELADDIRTVTRSAASGRPVPRRLRAFFLPEDGVRWWTRTLTRAADAPGRWLDAAVDRLPRRQ